MPIGIPPVTTSNIPAGWNANSVIVAFETNEISTTYYTLDGTDPYTSPTHIIYTTPFLIADDGITTVMFASKNSFGVLNLPQTKLVKIDRQPPTTVLSTNFVPDGANGWYLTQPAITLSAADVTSGVDKIFYAWDGGAYNEYTGSISIPSAGSHFLQFFAQDVATNREYAQTAMFKLDLDAPTTFANIPLGTATSVPTISFTLSDDASGVHKIYYTIDGTTPTTLSDSTVPFMITESGTYRVKYFSVDWAGRQEAIKTSEEFHVDLPDTSGLNLSFAESFPMNGEFGWYRSSPFIMIEVDKPQLVDKLLVKRNIQGSPTTATYTGTVNITTIDLFNRSLIAIEVDQSGTALEIDISGVVTHATTAAEIADRINTAFGGSIPIAFETGADGKSGTGHVTLVSPTAGIGSTISEIKFVAPSHNDGTLAVFGLSTSYPHTFTETLLFEEHSAPFLLSGDGIWEVTAHALDVNGDLSADFKKVYKLDSVDPVTSVVIAPPNLNGFYTAPTSITFNVLDVTSGPQVTYYQFDDGEINKYPGSPVFIPEVSGVRRLRYYSVDVAGNTENLNVTFFNYDNVDPVTSIDVDATNYGQANLLEIAFSGNVILDFNEQTHEPILAPISNRQEVSYYYGWTNDLYSRVYDPENIAPNIIVNDPLRLFLKAVDDNEFVITGEISPSKTSATNEIKVQHGFLKHVIKIRNQTQSKDLHAQYFSDDTVYVVPDLLDPTPFIDSDVIVVDYSYTEIDKTYYTTDGSTPTTASAQGHVIDLDQSGIYTIKYFSIDRAGNVEAVKTFPATITINSRVPVVSANLSTSPDGTNGWYITAPTLNVTVTSPNAVALSQRALAGNNTFTINVPGQGKIDFDTDIISVIAQVQNVTTSESYTVVSSTLNPDNSITVNLSGTAAPTPTDEVLVDYTFRTLLQSGNVQIGLTSIPFNPNLPFPVLVTDQGTTNVVVSAIDKRGLSGTKTVIVKFDSNAPSTTDDAVTGYVNTDVVVTLTSTDAVPGSGVSKIFYTTNGSSPTLLSAFITGSSGQITLSATGVYNVKYFAVDVAGNQESIKTSAAVQIDKTPPTTSVIVSAPDGQNGWYIANPLISLSANDLNSGVAQSKYAWDAGSLLVYSAPFVMPGVGVHTLHFFSIDNMGNVEISNSTVFKFDNDVPSTTDDVPAAWTNDGVINFTIVDSSSPTFKTYYTLDGSVPTLSSAFTSNAQINVPASGIYTLKYFSVDEAGHTESVKTAPNQLRLDLEPPAVISIVPNTVVFTPFDLNLVVTIDDSLSGVDISTVKIVVDDIEFSAVHNSSFFSSSGSPASLTITIGPVANIPAFDVVDTIVIYASDIAGNALQPVVLSAISSDSSGPYIRGTWPKNGADDVSRATAVSFFIDDDKFGVDMRTLSVKIENSTYAIVAFDAINVSYTGSVTGTYIDVSNNNLTVSEGGVIIAEISFYNDAYNTVKKVSEFIDSLVNFSSTTNGIYDQEKSTEIMPAFRLSMTLPHVLSVARKEENKNINYFPKSNGFLVTITPNEKFDDDFLVHVTINAKDFAGNSMPAEAFSFTVHEAVTPSREVRNRWDRDHLDIINRIRTNLESTYNKRSDSTVFHGHLKTLAFEIARALQVSEDYRDDSYYDGGTTRPELLYQNLGYLLKFEPRERFTHEKYRQVLLALIKTYLTGSTPESVAEAISLFIDVPGVTIKEAINNPLLDISYQFMFTLDIDLGSLIDPIVDLSAVDADIKAVIKQIKPAHTAFLLRYFFSEVFNLKNIIDQDRMDLVVENSDDMRTDCSGAHAPQPTTEDVSDQFTGVETCFTVSNVPILTLDGSTITMDPSDVELDVSIIDGNALLLNNPVDLLNGDDLLMIPFASTPISIIAVDGSTGRICLSRAPFTFETVRVTYTYNPYLVYRDTTFKLNTFTLNLGTFDLNSPSLLNQPRAGDPARIANPPGYSHIIWPVPPYAVAHEYNFEINNPETLHAHFCETLLAITFRDSESESDVYPHKENIDDYIYLNRYEPEGLGYNPHVTRLINDRRWVLYGGLEVTASQDDLTYETMETDTAPTISDILGEITVGQFETLINVGNDDLHQLIVFMEEVPSPIDILKNHNFIGTPDPLFHPSDPNPPFPPPPPAGVGWPTPLPLSFYGVTNSSDSRIISPAENTEKLQEFTYTP